MRRRISEGPTPQSGIKLLVKKARAAGTAAVEGLKATLFDIATGTEPTSIDAMRKGLTVPRGPGQTSILDIMIANKLMTRAEQGELNKLFDAARKIETALKSAGKLQTLSGQLESVASDIPETIARAGGSMLGSFIARYLGITSTLIAQSAAAKMTARFATKLPMQNVRDISIEAAKNPRVAAELLTIPATEKEAARLFRRLHGYFVQNLGRSYDAAFGQEDTPMQAPQ